MAFHWLMIIPIAGLLLGGNWLADQPVPVKIDAIGAHALTGSILLLLVIARFLWRITHPVAPPDRFDVPRWHWAIARTVHLAFYAVLAAQPLIGLAMATLAPYPVSLGTFLVLSEGSGDPALFETLALLHRYTARLLLGLIALHILAVMYHSFQGDGVNRRMLPLRKRVGSSY